MTGPVCHVKDENVMEDILSDCEYQKEGSGLYSKMGKCHFVVQTQTNELLKTEGNLQLVIAFGI